MCHGAVRSVVEIAREKLELFSRAAVENGLVGGTAACEVGVLLRLHAGHDEVDDQLGRASVTVLFERHHDNNTVTVGVLDRQVEVAPSRVARRRYDPREGLVDAEQFALSFVDHAFTPQPCTHRAWVSACTFSTGSTNIAGSYQMRGCQMMGQQPTDRREWLGYVESMVHAAARLISWVSVWFDRSFLHASCV